MQAGFRPRYRLEDLVFPVDYLLSCALTEGTGLGLCFINFEKAFDTVPHAKLISLLLHHYQISPDLVEQVCCMYIGTYGTVSGDTERFNTMRRACQGYPLSPLLFGLFFDRIVAHIKSTLPPSHAVAFANVAA